MLEIYTAGFLDADGSLRLARDRASQPEHTRFPVVEFYNCDKTILEKIQERWGGRLFSKKQKNPDHNVSYTLKLSYDTAFNLLKDVSPYMIHQKKAYRAKLIVDQYKELTPRNGQYTEKMIERKLALVEQVMGTTMRGRGAYENYSDGP